MNPSHCPAPQCINWRNTLAFLILAIHSNGDSLRGDGPGRRW
jgi:hypothetical protein